MALISPKSNIGAYSFLAGILLSILAVYFANPIVGVLVLATAVIVGMSNVQKKEENVFLLAIIGIGVVGFVAFQTAASTVPMLGTFLAAVVGGVGGYFTLVAAVFLVVFIWGKLKN